MYKTRFTRRVLRLLLPFSLAVIVALLTLAVALAVEIPPANTVAYIQTTGPNANLGIGDWYTNVAGDNGSHEIEIYVPCLWPDDVPVTFALFDPESNAASGTPLATDEIRGTGQNPEDNTAFLLTAPGGATIAETYTPNGGTDGQWVEFVTVTPETPNFGCGLYLLNTTTSNNDDNAWRLRVSYDLDCDTGGPYPQSNTCTSAELDNGNEQNDVDGILGTGDELLIGAVRASYQQDVSGACQEFYFFVNAADPTLTVRNFDMDFNPNNPNANISITLIPPPASGYAPSLTVSNLSGNAVWAEDSYPVDGDDVGWWRADVCITRNNQYIFEVFGGIPLFFEQPPIPDIILDKDDGETLVSPGNILTYTIVFTNVSSAVAQNVTLIDSLPPALTYISAQINLPYSGTVVEANNVVTFQIDQVVVAGATGSVQVVALVNDNPTAPIANTVSLVFSDILDNQYPPISDDDVDDVVDYGDLPASYGDASHVITTLYLDNVVDGDNGSQYSAAALGDDNDGLNDDDGVTAVGNWSDGTGDLQVVVTGGNGCLNAWLDFTNGTTIGANGTFGDIYPPNFSEHIIENTEVTAGLNALSFSLPLTVANNAAGWGLRVRLTPRDSDDGCALAEAYGGAASPTGLVVGGEVEDYVLNFSPTAVSLQNIQATMRSTTPLLLLLLGAVTLALTGLGVTLTRRRQT